jgi:DNA polymerase-3 subunit beta
MKLTLQRSHLTNALSRILSVVSTKTSLPVLSNVLVDASIEGEIALSATNLDASASCRIRGQVTQAGAVTLPAKRLAAIVRELPAEMVALEVSAANQALITSGSSVFRVPGISRDDFPAIPAVPDGTAWRLKQEVLAMLLRQVTYAQSRDETRFVLNGVLLQFKEGHLTAVATDGRRLAWARHPLGAETPAEAAFILPAAFVATLGRMLGIGQEVALQFSERRCAFRLATDADGSGLVGDLELSSKLVEAKYPDFTQVLPKEQAARVEFDRTTLQNAIHRAALVCSDKANTVALHFAPHVLAITARSPDVGDAREELPTAYDGPEVTIAFNPAFLLDPLGAFAQDKVALGIKDDVSPATVEVPECTCVVMPVRLN